jgi:hypothetical protein
MIEKTAPIVSISWSLPTTLAAEVHRAEEVFIRWTNIKGSQVPNFASGNTKTNIFQEGSAGFKATRDLN